MKPLLPHVGTTSSADVNDGCAHNNRANHPWASIQRFNLSPFVPGDGGLTVHPRPTSIRASKNIFWRHQFAFRSLVICHTLILPLSSVAAWSQWGLSALQWPHHGAKNSTIQASLLCSTSSSKLLSVSSITSLPSPPVLFLPPLPVLVLPPNLADTVLLSSSIAASARPCAVRAPDRIDIKLSLVLL